MRATIVYFSQTGNTEKVAYELADQLQRAGYEVTPLLFEDMADFPEALHGIDILGIGFPTFFGHPPQFVLDEIACLEEVADGTGAFVFTTYGGATAGDSLFDTALILAKKGYRIRGGLKIEGSDSYPQGKDLKINVNRPDTSDMRLVDEFAGKLIEAHGSCRDGLDPIRLAGTGEFFVKNRQLPRDEVIQDMRKSVEGRIVFNQSQCLFCEACKKSCPTRCISTGEAFPEFSWKCINGTKCYQCVQNCPGKALRVEYPGSLEDYIKFRGSIADTPEEKSRAYIMA